MENALKAAGDLSQLTKTRPAVDLRRLLRPEYFAIYYIGRLVEILANNNGLLVK